MSENNDEIEHIRKHVSDANEDALFMDGFDECIVGFTLVQTEEGTKAVACYSLPAVIKKHMDSGMTEDEAYEYFNFNQLSANMGANSPTFIVPTWTP